MASLRSQLIVAIAVGHLFQGRFKGILVEKDSHLLELSRYVVLNPVRAGMVGHGVPGMR